MNQPQQQQQLFLRKNKIQQQYAMDQVKCHKPMKAMNQRSAMNLWVPWTYEDHASVSSMRSGHANWIAATGSVRTYPPKSKGSVFLMHFPSSGMPRCISLPSLLPSVISGHESMSIWHVNELEATVWWIMNDPSSMNDEEILSFHTHPPLLPFSFTTLA